MKSIDSHLSAIKFPTLEFKSVHESGMLFEIDVRVATEQGHCPYCLRVLYDMRDKPFMWCRNKQHKQFIISKAKVRPI